MTAEQFAEFVKEHKAKIYAHAEQNTKRNAKGQAVISRDDPWFYDDVWSEDKPAMGFFYLRGEI